MNNNPFPQSDDRMLSYLLNKVSEDLFRGDEKPKRNDIKVAFYILALITIICTEPLKVILRNNIGKLSLSMPRLLLACLLYGGYAAALAAIGSNGSPYTPDNVFFIVMVSGCVLYGIIMLYVLVMGLIDYFKASEKYNENPADLLTHIYRGDSTIFKYLLNKGWTQEKIWLKKEPRVCFFIGLLLTLLPFIFDPYFCLLGAPLLLTSISFWFNEWYQIRNVWNSQNKKILQAQEKQRRNQEYSTNNESFLFVED